MMRFALRAARLLIHIHFGLLLVLWIRLFSWTGRVDFDGIARRWLLRLIRILGLRFAVKGEPLVGGQLIVCNHVSWLDIPLVGAALCSRFVAKSEIQNWPVAGWYANAIGTFYIRRGTGGSRPLLDKLTPHLHAGGSVVIFPEGTTTDGHEVMPFHARLFQAAIEAKCPVQPVALRYGLTESGEEVAPFIGDDDLASHMIRLLKSPGITAELTYCPPLHVEHFADRQSLAHDAEEAIRRVVAPQPAAKRPALLELQARLA